MIRASQIIRRYLAGAVAGQSMAEYALSLSLIAIVSLGALSLVGGNLGTLLQNLRDNELGMATAQAKMVQDKNIQAKLDRESAQENHFATQGKSCFSNGWCVDLSEVGDDHHVESTGVNGSQEVILAQVDVLKQLAEQAANDPNADPDLALLLTQLANAGHTIGDTLGNSILAYGTGSFGTAYDSFWRSQIPYDALRDQTFEYLKQHPGTLPAGIEEILQGATSEINAQMNSMIDSNGPVYDSWNVLLNEPSSVTQPIYDNANTICRNGGIEGQCIR